MRWLHRLSFLSGGERYAASLSYFYFDAAMRAALFTPEALAAARQASHAEDAIRTAVRATATGDPLDRMLCADSEVRLPDHPVMITDRMSMAHGLEARSPFMDHRLAEFAARLPSSMKIRGRTLRYRAAQAGRPLPAAEISERPKQGFSSALPYMLRQRISTAVRRFLPDSQLVRAGILRARADRCAAAGAPCRTCRPRQSSVAADQRGALVSNDDSGRQP